MKNLALLFILVGTLLSFNIASEAKELNADKNNLIAGNVAINNVSQTYYVYRRRYNRPRYRRITTYRTYQTYRYTPRYQYRRTNYRTIYIPRYRNRTYYRQPMRYQTYRRTYRRY